MEVAASLGAGEGAALVKALLAQGLVERAGREVWSLSQAGRTFAAATAAKRLTRAAAERALAEFLQRVERVNANPYFLGKVTRLVLFGSMLNPATDRPSDIDLAVEIAPKEADFDHLVQQNYDRVEDLASMGRRFRNIIDVVGCWHWEVLRYLKGGSRAISLADYKVEKALVLAVPHRVLIGDDEPAPTPSSEAPMPRRRRRPRDCPF